MAQRNIVISLTNPDPLYISSDIRYARVDNTVSPIYTTYQNVTANPFIIQNVENGQYRIYAKPNYSDDRICPEQYIDTAPCVGITSLSAEFNSPNFSITYTAEEDVPSVRVNISFPNGGFSNTIVENTGDTITIEAPAGVYGTFFITMQPVCDEDTGWFGVATAPVTVEVPEPSP